MKNKISRWFKAVVVVILLIGPVRKIPTLSMSDLIDWFLFLSMVVILIVVLKKWYLEYKNKIKEKTFSDKNENTGNYASNGAPLGGVSSDPAIEDTKYFLIINIIFIVFSVINGFLVAGSSSLVGSASAQDVLVYILILPIYTVLAIISSVISYRKLNSAYIMSGWLAIVLLPIVAAILDQWGVYLFDLGLDYISVTAIMAMVTLFIVFSRPMNQLIKALKK